MATVIHFIAGTPAGTGTSRPYETPDIGNGDIQAVPGT